MDVDATVRDLATRSFVGVSEGDAVREAAALMARSGDDAVVLRGEEPVGHLSATTVLELVADGVAGDRDVGEVMDDPVPAIEADRPVADAAALLGAEGVGQLLVRNGGDLLGVITERDVVAAAAMGPAPGARDGTGESVGAAGAAGDAAGGVGESLGVPASELDELAPEAERQAPAGGGFSDQSVCEACGSFAPDLASVQGQLLCADCRQV